MFALNVGIEFITPEALFGGSDVWADPETIGCSATRPPEIEAGACASAGAAGGGDALALVDPPSPCVVIMVGSPASGKTRLAMRLVHERGFTHVSSDTQGERHMHAYEHALAAGKDIVVDNTNALAAKRMEYASRAWGKEYGIIICHVATPKEVCFHLNAARCQLDPTGRTREVPPVALHTYWSRLEVPTEKGAESFGAKLITIPFGLAPDAPPEVTRLRYPTG